MASQQLRRTGKVGWWPEPEGLLRRAVDGPGAAPEVRLPAEKDQNVRLGNASRSSQAVGVTGSCCSKQG